MSYLYVFIALLFCQTLAAGDFDNDGPRTQPPAPTSPPKLNQSYPHTACFNYYLKKDGCVHGAMDESQRCKDIGPGSGHSSSVGLFDHPSKVPRLRKRYDNPVSAFPIDGGDGICGSYSTEQPGVCLWSGLDPEGKDPARAGWMNGANIANCGKHIYVMRKSDPSKVVYAPLLDGCGLLANITSDGCPRISLTTRTFRDLFPTFQENKTAAIDHLIWDFVNLKGDDRANGAY